MAPSPLLNGTLMWINATSGVFFVAPMLSGVQNCISQMWGYQ